MDTLKRMVRDLDTEVWPEFLGWVVGEERARRDSLHAVEQARAEDTQKLWEAHPELKPEFAEEPVEVDTSKTVTLADLLAKYPPYKQPTGAHDALPTGAIVTDEGRIWRTDLPTLNAWKPGTPNTMWVDITDELLAQANQVPQPEETDAPEEPEPEPETETEGPGVQEWAPNLNVAPGERYTFQGDTYEVVQGHTSASHWPPNAVPALYKKV